MARRKEETEDVASYVNQLSSDEKAWMNQFMKEYNNADTKNAIFHTTAEEKKICNDKNNARNRCDYTIASAKNMLNLIENDFELEKILYSDLKDDELIDPVEAFVELSSELDD